MRLHLQLGEKYPEPSRFRVQGLALGQAHSSDPFQGLGFRV